MNNFDFIVSNMNSITHSVIAVNDIAFLNYDSRVIKVFHWHLRNLPTPFFFQKHSMDHFQKASALE